VPSSAPETISRIAGMIRCRRPRSVLDLGVGYGKYGLLVRELLESWEDRVYPSQWQVRLVGVEGCRRYVDSFGWLAEIYSRIIVGDLALHDSLKGLGRFDLVLLCDVLEHLEKDSGACLLVEAQRRAKGSLVLSVPLGEAWLGNVVVGGNDLERHRASWSEEDLVDVLGVATSAERVRVGSREILVGEWEA